MLLSKQKDLIKLEQFKSISKVYFPETEKSIKARNKNAVKVFVKEFYEKIISDVNQVDVPDVYVDFSTGYYATDNMKFSGKLNPSKSNLSKVKNKTEHISDAIKYFKSKETSKRFTYICPFQFKNERRNGSEYDYKDNGNYTFYILDFDFKTKDKKLDFVKFKDFLKFSSGLLYDVLKFTSGYIQVTRSGVGFRVILPLKNSLNEDIERSLRKWRMVELADYLCADTKIYDNSRLFFSSYYDILPIIHLNKYGYIFMSNSNFYNYTELLKRFESKYNTNIISLSLSTSLEDNIKNINISYTNSININNKISRKERDDIIYNTQINNRLDNRISKGINKSLYNMVYDRVIDYIRNGIIDINEEMINMIREKVDGNVKEDELREVINEIIRKEKCKRYVDDVLESKYRDVVKRYKKEIIEKEDVVVKKLVRFDYEDMLDLREMFGTGINGLRNFLSYMSNIIELLNEDIKAGEYYIDSLRNIKSFDDYFRLSITPEEKSVGDMFFYAKTYAAIYFQSENAIKRLPEEMQKKVKKDKSKHYYLNSYYLLDVVEFSFKNYGLDIEGLKYKLGKIFKLNSIITNYKVVISKIMAEVINETIKNGECRLNKIFPIDFKNGVYKKEIFKEILRHVLEMKDTNGNYIFFLEKATLKLNPNAKIDFDKFINEDSELTENEELELSNFLDYVAELFSLMYNERQEISTFYYAVNETLKLNKELRTLIYRLYTFDSWCEYVLSKVNNCDLYNRIQNITLHYEYRQDKYVDYRLEEIKHLSDNKFDFDVDSNFSIDKAVEEDKHEEVVRCVAAVKSYSSETEFKGLF